MNFGRRPGHLRDFGSRTQIESIPPTIPRDSRRMSEQFRRDTNDNGCRRDGGNDSDTIQHVRRDSALVKPT